MVYVWNDKEAECYRLYVEERKSLDEVMQVMKDEHGFTPSKRAYQTQFKRWEFPSKQNPAHKNEPLVERTKELWEKNTGQRDMLRILNAEGFDIKERELMRVRAKHKLLLRVPNGTRTGGTGMANNNAGAGEDGDSTMQNIEQVVIAENENPEKSSAVALTSPSRQLASGELPPEILEKRRARLQKLQQESVERWQTKKRRRRTRGWAGLPADPPGPPRFPSETTIDESKAYLKLDNNLYRELRDQFQGICEEAGFIKKTMAGPEKWKAAKDRLVAENVHLQTHFYHDASNIASKQLSLDVLCTDVTKRMRTLERRMTIAEAKNVMGINPAEARIIRQAFYEILLADRFTSKMEAGGKHWKELKEQWVAGSGLLQQILAQGEADPTYENKLKAMEIICRDVMKRLRDDQTKRDPTRRKQINTGPGPGPAPPRITANPPAVNYPQASAPTAPITNTLTSTTNSTRKSGRRPNRKAARNDAELQIDPSLLAAAADPSMALAEQLQQYASASSNLPPTPASRTQSHPSDPGPIPIFFRLHSQSPFQGGPKVWLGSLPSTTASIDDLRALAARSHPAGADAVQRVEGLVTDENGQEIPYVLERDDELAGYLDFVNSAAAGDQRGDAGKAMFVVALAA